MGEPAVPNLQWRVRELPPRRWRGWLIRTVAEADVLAPDGRPYAVRVVRILWPRDSPGADIASDLLPYVVEAAVGALSLVTGRRVWGVRVFGAAPRFSVRPLVYGEELIDRDTAVQRGLEIAQGLAAGRKP